MTTANELLADPWLGINSLNGVIATQKGGDGDELAHFSITDTDIKDLVVKIYGNGSNAAVTVRQNLRQFVTEAEFEDSIEKANTFTITVHDPDWELLNSGALNVPVDINPGGVKHLWYRLDSYEVEDDEITLIFATRNAVFLEGHKKPFKVSRNKATRAEAILMMLRKVKIVKIRLYCPELHKKQKIAKFSSDSDRKQSHDRSSGFTKSDKITVKGVPANAQQKKTISQVVEAGKDLNIPGLVIVSAVMCIIQESGAGARTTGNPPYVGPFQQNRSDGWPATGDAYKDAIGNKKRGVKQGGYYGWIMPIYQANPDVDLGQLVAKGQGVLGSTNPLNAGYAGSTDRWRDEAQHAVNSFDPSIDINDPGGTTTTSFRKKYEFMVGPPDGGDHENYLGAAYRLAEQVNWSFYWVRDVAHYISQEDLFKAKARTRLRRFKDGVEGISFSYDRMKHVQSMQLRVRMERWVCPIGTVAIFDEGGQWVQGRWIVTSIRRSMFDTLGTIVLSKPINEKLEPAPGSQTRNDSTQTTQDVGTEDGAKGIVDDCVQIAIEAGGSEVAVVSDYRPGSVTTSGSVSDHSRNDSHQAARDIGKRGVDAIVGPPSRELDKACVAIGKAFGRTYHEGQVVDADTFQWKGYRIQIIWRTPKYGGHMGHVHVGARASATANTQTHMRGINP